ncbi:MAG: single-stranded DNA-binding protein [Chthoniobacterales bacterium]
MASVNKVILIGNVTRDPELKYTPKGTAVTEVGLAVNRNYNTDSGDRKEETTFVDITLWGKTAEIACQYLKKGRPVYFEGRLQLDSWEDKQSGAKRSRLRVVGETMQFLGGGGTRSDSDGGGYENRPSRSQSSGYESRRSEPSGSQSDDDDIPF